MTHCRIVCVSCLFCLTALSSSAQFKNYKITSDTSDQCETAIAVNPVNPNVLLAAWNDWRPNPGFLRVKPGFAFSVDGGLTWKDSVIWDAASYGDADPSVAFNRYGYAFYCHFTTRPEGYYVVVDRTTVFQPPYAWQRKQVDAPATDDKPYMAVDNTGIPGKDGRIYVTWYEPNTHHIKFAFSSDTANTFSSAQQLDVNGGYGAMPAVAPNGDLYVVWKEVHNGYNASFYKLRRSTDGGVNFDASIRLVATYTDSVVSIGVVHIDNLPSIAINPMNNDIYVAFAERASFLNPQLRVKWTKSTNNGVDWAPVQIVGSFSQGKQFYPALAAEPTGRLWISFLHSADTLVNTYSAYSLDNGQSFTAPVLVSDSISDPKKGSHDGHRVDYLGATSVVGVSVPCWTDFRNGHDANPYAASVTGQTTSSKPFATAYGCSPKLEYSEKLGRWNSVFTSNGDLFYAYSTDDGSSWYDYARVSGSVGGIDIISDPAIVEDTASGILHVVFVSSGQGVYYNKRSTNGSWLSGGPVQLYASTQASYPALTIAGSTAHVVFVEYNNSLMSPAPKYYLTYATFDTSSPAGTFTIRKEIDGPTTVLTGTSLVRLFYGGELHVVYTKAGEIYYSHGTGSGWTAPIDISNTSGVSELPSLLGYSTDVNTYSLHVVWQDNTTGNYDVYYRANSSGSWQGVSNLTNDQDSSLYPAITDGWLGSSRVTMWTKHSSSPGSNYYIYYMINGGPASLLATATVTSSISRSGIQEDPRRRTGARGLDRRCNHPVQSELELFQQHPFEACCFNCQNQNTTTL